MMEQITKTEALRKWIAAEKVARKARAQSDKMLTFGLCGWFFFAILLIYIIKVHAYCTPHPWH
jgi:hypothetical protein